MQKTVSGFIQNYTFHGHCANWSPDAVLSVSEARHYFKSEAY